MRVIDRAWAGLTKALALICVAVLAALSVVLVPGPAARAEPIAVEGQCHASLTASDDAAALREQPRHWRCDDGGWTLSGPGMVLRYRLYPSGVHARPKSLVTLAVRFARMEIRAEDDNGLSRSVLLDQDDARRLPAGPIMVLPLPHITDHTRLIEVRILRPWSKAIGSEAQLDSASDGTGWSIGEIVGVAAICGLLVVPLLLNAAFYGALRERFVLWHMALTASMLLQALIGSGFIHLLVTVTETVLAPLSNLFYAIMASAALMFAADFTEAGMLPPRLSRALPRVAAVIFAVGCLTALPFEWMRPYATTLIHLDMVPAMVLVLVSAFVARRRGSRAAIYQLAAWSPTFLVGFWKIGLYILPEQRPLSAMLVYQLGLAVQVVITSIAIVSRFVDMRMERDRARERALELEGVAGRDALTGLRNRHAIERRFTEMFDSGFRTMAVIDLDHFKQVNDRHGHAVGDHVLRAAAAALDDDGDCHAIRMGGEEFMLLLRGDQAGERAERCRRAISTRVALDVPGLDRVVTASMGLVEHDPGGRLQVEFETLYTHCDRLLYEAKRLGRNCTMRERVTGFAPHVAPVAVRPSSAA